MGKSFWTHYLGEATLCVGPVFYVKHETEPLFLHRPIKSETYSYLDKYSQNVTFTGESFSELFEGLDKDADLLYMVDAGVTVNCPFPVLLRPQRNVDVIICFNFDSRESDFDSDILEVNTKTAESCAFNCCCMVTIKLKHKNSH